MSRVEAFQNSKCLCQGSADRISNLPTELSLRILQCLSMRDAARTSVLSRYWTCKWRSLPHIILDLAFFKDYFLKGRGETRDICVDYMLVVNDILFSHVGPISLRLYIPCLFPKNAAISQWIRHVCAKSVKCFIVHDARHPKTKLPTCLFPCVGLLNLSLIGCKLPSLPATFSGFPTLVTLNLFLCAPSAYNSNTLGILISTCPQLITVNMDCIQNFQSDLTICAPNLQNLSMVGKLSKLCLEAPSNLKKCNIDVECEEWYHSWRLDNYFSCLANVETLFLMRSFWKATLHHEFIPPKKFSKQLQQLKTLHLGSVPLNCSSTISFILCVFETCPHLERLFVEVDDYKDNPVGHLPQSDTVCSLQRLKTVQLISSIYKSCELQFIKLLLACSPALEVMTIVLRTTGGLTEGKYNLACELLEYGRASPKARIVLKTTVSKKTLSWPSVIL